MDDIISDFNKRADEIEKYFKFLKNVVEEDASLFFRDKLTHKTKVIDDDLQKILKANSFILLYNLVESSFKLTLQRLSHEINASNNSYKDTIPEIRKIWLQHEKKYFAINPNGMKKLDYFYDTITDIANQVLTVPTALENVGISGNLDARKIKDCAAIYGIPSRALKNKDCNKLFLVKNNRNNLAHGDVSFANCGRNYDFGELNDIKKEVVSYMRFILRTFKSSMESRYYVIS